MDGVGVEGQISGVKWVILELGAWSLEVAIISQCSERIGEREAVVPWDGAGWASGQAADWSPVSPRPPQLSQNPARQRLQAPGCTFRLQISGGLTLRHSGLALSHRLSLTMKLRLTVRDLGIRICFLTFIQGNFSRLNTRLSGIYSRIIPFIFSLQNGLFDNYQTITSQLL